MCAADSSSAQGGIAYSMRNGPLLNIYPSAMRIVENWMRKFPYLCFPAFSILLIQGVRNTRSLYSYYPPTAKILWNSLQNSKVLLDLVDR